MIIQDHEIDVRVGDIYQHDRYGKGVVAHINDSPESKYPIKVHFKDVGVYEFFDVFGMQYSGQSKAHIHFPIAVPVRPELSKWDIRYLELALFYSTWSKDPSTQVGAVIVRGKNEQVSHGWNGFPAGVADTTERLNDRAKRLALTLHAEANAILKRGTGKNLAGTTIYVTMPPCSKCAITIIQASISKVVYLKAHNAFMQRWGDDVKLSMELFDEAGIEVVAVDRSILLK